MKPLKPFNRIEKSLESMIEGTVNRVFRPAIQPSEIAKIAAVLFTALTLERRMHRIDELSYSLLPIAIVVGGMSGLILLEPDLGTAASLVMIVGAFVIAMVFMQFAVVARLKRLTEATQQISLGKPGELRAGKIDPKSHNELDQLALATERLRISINMAIQRLTKRSGS